MTSMNVCWTPGAVCLEVWVVDRKVTVYVLPSGKTECLMIHGAAEIEETDNLYAAMKWLHDSSDPKGAKE